MQIFIDWLLAMLAAPAVGLPAVFIVSFVAATLLPMGSEPALFAYVKLAPHMFWPAIGVATLGNTLGGMLDWWLGYAARGAALRVKRARRHARRAAHAADTGHTDHAAYLTHSAAGAPTAPAPVAAPPPRAATPAAPPLGAGHVRRMRRFGPVLLLGAWLPVIGDPLCVLAGWLRLPLGPCVTYMALGKLARYIVTTAVLLWVPDHFWAGIWGPLHALLPR